MRDFEWSKFSKRVFIKAPLSKVYDAWTIPEIMEKWFLLKANFYSSNGDLLSRDCNIFSGTKYSWNWYAQNHSEDGDILCANGKDYIEFTFAGKCIVSVNLKELNGVTSVELLQSEIPLDDISKERIRLGCAFGWTFYLTNLKSILEGGIDLRNKDINIKGVVNN